jgi:Domain of unknown function (DUF4037)
LPEFIPARELARLFYMEAVRPILEADYPGLVHSAGLAGPGSEVLGFDTEMSTDHHWGPRVGIYLAETDHARLAGELSTTLGHKLPFTFRGWPTHFEPVPDDPGTEVPKLTNSRPINHHVQVTTLHRFVREYIGVELDRELTVLDWLTIPEQNLRTLTAGAVYHDGLSVLEPMRLKLAYYPHDVWLYLLSAQWQRIGQEEPFVGRTGIAGDDLGSAVIAARLVRDVMRLCLLMERQYAPYAKWFGTAFARLRCATALTPIFQSVLRATYWQEREKHLSAAYEVAVSMHNELGITAPVASKVSRFWNRPFWVIHAEKIARTIWEAIEDQEVKRLPFGVGKVDQYVDNTDILSHIGRCRRLGVLYSEF